MRRPYDWDGLIVWACRYFHADPVFWENHLTGRLTRAMNAELLASPPADWSVAAFLGVKPASEPEDGVPARGLTPEDNARSVAALAAMFPRGEIRG